MREKKMETGSYVVSYDGKIRLVRLHPNPEELAKGFVRAEQATADGQKIPGFRTFRLEKLEILNRTGN
jgi:hypothetical protein